MDTSFLVGPGSTGVIVSAPSPMSTATAIISPLQVPARPRTGSLSHIHLGPSFAPSSPLIGREREVAAALALLLNGPRRLVTLTGPGGVGKTRLAGRLAAICADHVADSIAIVSLAAVPDATLAPRAVAAALGVGTESDDPWLTRIVAALDGTQSLLVLDNLEHLLPAAAFVADLLAACPGLRILATSRERLRLSDEQEFPVPPLSQKREDNDLLPVFPSSRVAVSSDAVTLFLERARAVRPAFAPSDADIAAIAAICRRLDGLPLAIELAAARVVHLPPAALLQALDRSLPLLTGGPRDAPPRHRTMRDAIAWSVSLLDDRARAVFARLGVFSGGFGLDAVEAVAFPEDEESTSLDDGNRPAHTPPARFVDAAFETIGLFVDANLVQLVPTSGLAPEPRFTMLETIREYARELLDEGGEAGRVATRLAGWLTDLNDRAAVEIRGPNQAVWLVRMDQERANFRAMTSWALDHADAETALRLTTKAAWFYWETRGLMREESRLLIRALEIAETDPDRVDATLHGRGLMAHGMRLAVVGDFAAADRRMEAAIAALTRGGDQDAVASAQSNYATVLAERGDYVRARDLYERAAEYRRLKGDPRRRIPLLVNIGAMLTGAGDLDGARDRLDEAAPFVDEIGEPRDRAYVAYFRGEIALFSGYIPDAIDRLTAAHGHLSQIPDISGVAMAAAHLGLAHTLNGDIHAAAVSVTEALEKAREIGAMPIVTSALDVLGGILLGAGRPADAVRTLGMAAGLRASMGVTIRPIDLPRHTDLTRAARAELGVNVFTEAEQAGRSLPSATAIAQAIDLATTVGGMEVRPARLAGHGVSNGAADDVVSLLSEREQTVLGLIARGDTDRAIGDELSISPRTVSNHVRNILAKLDVPTRTAAAAVAFQQGLTTGAEPMDVRRQA